MSEIVEVKPGVAQIIDGYYTPKRKQYVRLKPSSDGKKGKPLYQLGAGKHVPVFEVRTFWPSGDTWMRISEDRWTALMVDNEILGEGEWIYDV